MKRILSIATVGLLLASPALRADEPTTIAAADQKHFRHSEGSAVQLTPGGRLLLAWSRFSVEPGKPRDDNGPATLVIAHSDDAGRTWSDPRPLPVGQAKVNIMQAGFLPLADRLQLYFSVRDGDRNAKFVIESRDAGTTWTERRQVSDPAVRLLTGPNDRMLQTRGGRIVLPAHAVIDDKTHDMRPIVTYSDDRGTTWTTTPPLAADAAEPVGKTPAVPIKLHEPAVAECRDGSLLMVARSTRGRFYRSTSLDGGKTWTPLSPVADLPAAAAPPYLKRLSDGRLLLFWNPPTEEQVRKGNYPPAKRPILQLAVSTDDGASWSAPQTVANDGGRHGFCYPWAVELAGRGELLVFFTRTPQTISPGDLVMCRLKTADLPRR
jgi:hypothetical protein